MVGPKRLLHNEIGVDRAAVESGQPRAMTSSKHAFYNIFLLRFQECLFADINLNVIIFN